MLQSKQRLPKKATFIPYHTVVIEAMNILLHGLEAELGIHYHTGGNKE